MENKERGIKWLKRLGIAGFLFFTIKGLIWLALGAAAFLIGTSI